MNEANYGGTNWEKKMAWSQSELEKENRLQSLPDSKPKLAMGHRHGTMEKDTECVNAYTGIQGSEMIWGGEKRPQEVPEVDHRSSLLPVEEKKVGGKPNIWKNF